MMPSDKRCILPLPLQPIISHCNSSISPLDDLAELVENLSIAYTAHLAPYRRRYYLTTRRKL